jgi:hypothetical protein
MIEVESAAGRRIEKKAFSFFFLLHVTLQEKAFSPFFRSFGSDGWVR